MIRDFSTLERICQENINFDDAYNSTVKIYTYNIIICGQKNSCSVCSPVHGVSIKKNPQNHKVLKFGDYKNKVNVIGS